MTLTAAASDAHAVGAVVFRSASGLATRRLAVLGLAEPIEASSERRS
jgi:hypothetical protein